MRASEFFSEEFFGEELKKSERCRKRSSRQEKEESYRGGREEEERRRDREEEKERTTRRRGGERARGTEGEGDEKIYTGERRGGMQDKSSRGTSFTIQVDFAELNTLDQAKSRNPHNACHRTNHEAFQPGTDDPLLRYPDEAALILGLTRDSQDVHLDFGGGRGRPKRAGPGGRKTGILGGLKIP